MDFQTAVSNYRADPSKVNMRKQASLLTAEMSLNEKIYMLSGHPIAQIQVDMIRSNKEQGKKVVVVL